MYRKKLIAALAVLIFIPAVTTAVGKRIDSETLENIFSGKSSVDVKEQASIVLAQNEKSNQEEGQKSEAESATDTSEAAADDEKKSSEAESKPLKPFVPSEQIAGEQAVDFPADI